MSRHIARFEVSGQLIADSLAMPEGTKIYNIVRHDYVHDVFVFYVENPDLPVVPEAGMPTEISPTITADYAKKPATWQTFSWGINPSVDKPVIE